MRGMALLGRASALGLALVVVSSTPRALALKPCPDPCDSPTGASCEAVAQWIAIGRIENVKPIPFTGGGVTMRFAEFDFVAEQFEKGGAPNTPTRIKSATRWCYHDDLVFEAKNKKVRVYARDALGTSDRTTYFAIREVTSEAPSTSAEPAPSPSSPASATPQPSPSASIAPAAREEPQVAPVQPRHCGCHIPRTSGGAGAPLLLFALLARRASRQPKSPETSAAPGSCATLR